MRRAAESVDAGPSRPILVHCVKGTVERGAWVHTSTGQHRTGCLMGCLRRIEGCEGRVLGWPDAAGALAPILEEYRQFAGPTVRLPDMMFIESFRIQRLRDS